MNITKETRIALIGVSSNPEKYGHKIFKDLLANEYSVVGVNPKGGEILGQTIYTSLKELPETPELVLLVVPPEIGINVVRSARDLGIKQIWCQPGAESDLISEYCAQNNIDLVRNSCLMTKQNIW